MTVDQDPDAAYALLYDGARQAVTAHLLRAGLRARNAPGGHEAVALYAVAAIEEDAGPSSTGCAASGTGSSTAPPISAPARCDTT